MWQKLKVDFDRLTLLKYGWPVALGLFLIPIDSFPYFPIDSAYRPLWIFPFCYIAIVSFFKKFTFIKFEKYLLLIIIALYIQALISYYYFDYEDNKGIIKTTFILPLLYLSLSGIYRGLDPLFKKYRSLGALVIITSIFQLNFLFIALLGFLQLFLLIIGIDSFNESIAQIFSYRFVPGRIHLTSGEPSWAARYLIFVGIFSILFGRRYVNKFVIPMIIILIIGTASVMSFLTILFLTFMYSWFYSSSKIKFTMKIILILFSMVIFLNYYEYIFGFSEYASDKINKVITLIKVIDFGTLMALASVDGSVLARLLNPIIAFNLGMIYPFGIGSDSFRYFYLDALNNLGYDGTSSEEYLLGAGSTPKFLFAKVFLECGWLFFSLFLYWLSKFILGSSKLKDINMRFLVVCIIPLTFSDDSYLFYGLLIPIVLAMLSRSDQIDNLK